MIWDHRICDRKGWDRREVSEIEWSGIKWYERIWDRMIWDGRKWDKKIKGFCILNLMIPKKRFCRSMVLSKALLLMRTTISCSFLKGKRLKPARRPPTKNFPNSFCGTRFSSVENGKINFFFGSLSTPVYPDSSKSLLCSTSVVSYLG